MSSISLNRLAYYTLQVFAANILGGLLIFLQPILILNLTQEHALGVFSLLVSWANIGMLLASFGLLTALQRLGSRYSIRNLSLELESYNYLKRCSLQNLLVAAFGLVTIAIIVHRGEVPLILFPAIMLVLSSIFYTRWYLILARIRENNFWPNIFDQSLREGLFVLTALLSLYMLNLHDDTPGTEKRHAVTLILAYTFSAAASAWISKAYAHIKNLVPSSANLRHNEPTGMLQQTSVRRLHKVWVGIARTSFPSEVGIYLIKRIDVIIVGIIISTESAGIYFLLSRIAELPTLLAGAINVIVGPEFAKMKARGYEERRRTLYIAAAILPTTATVLMIVGVWYADLLGLPEWAFGRRLDLSVLYIFLIGFTLFFALGPASVLLTMTGYQKISSMVTCYIVPYHLVSVVILAVWLGEMGAALAFTISINLQRIAELTYMAKVRRTVIKLKQPGAKGG